jgi:drug/metabolite transporter (DMT)-like permease
MIAMAGLLTSGRRLDIDAYKEDYDDPVPFWQTLALQAAIVPVAIALFTNVSRSTAHVDLLLLVGFVVLGLMTSVRQYLTTKTPASTASSNR